MIAKSRSYPRSAVPISCRLPIESVTSTFGWSLENPEIMNGTKYFAVLTAPIEMRPAVLPAIISSEVSQSAIAASIRSESASTSRPASVRSIPSPVR